MHREPTLHAQPNRSAHRNAAYENSPTHSTHSSTHNSIYTYIPIHTQFNPQLEAMTNRSGQRASVLRTGETAQGRLF